MISIGDDRLKGYKCKKCGGNIAQLTESNHVIFVKETGKKENYVCFNCWKIYKNVRIEEIADIEVIE